MKKEILCFLLIAISGCREKSPGNDLLVFHSQDKSQVLIISGPRSYMGTSDYPGKADPTLKYGSANVQYLAADKTISCTRYAGIVISYANNAHFFCGGVEFFRNEGLEGGHGGIKYTAICWNFREGKCEVGDHGPLPAQKIDYYIDSSGRLSKIYLDGVLNSRPADILTR